MTALTVDEALEAERILGVGYERTDINVWRSRCPICALFSDVPTLIISELREGGSAHISCKNGCENVEAALRAVLSKAGPWPKLGARQLPAFPVDALPTDVAEWVRAIAEESQTPTDLAAMGALGVLSAAATGAAVVD